MRTHALDGVPCTCGAAGCWERYASTSALVRRAVRTDPALDSGRAIFAAARQGDKAVLALLEGWIAEIAEGLAGLVHLFNPQLILIGGGVSSQQELLIDPLARQVKARGDARLCGRAGAPPRRPRQRPPAWWVRCATSWTAAPDPCSSKPLCPLWDTGAFCMSLLTKCNACVTMQM